MLTDSALLLRGVHLSTDRIRLRAAAKCVEKVYYAAHSGHHPLRKVLDSASPEKALESYERQRVEV